MLTILCVDSDEQQLAKLSNDLSKFNLLLACSIQQAKRLLTDSLEPIALIIAKQSLPDGETLTLFQSVKDKHTRKVIYYDSPDMDTLITGINQQQLHQVLSLPITTNKLIKVCKEQLNIYTSHSKTVVDTSTANYRDMFLDLHLYSDQELSKLVINSLNTLLQNNPSSGAKLTYSANHLLTQEGTPNRFLWFITKGRVQLKKLNSQGVEQDITIMEAGALIGGMSFLTAENAFSTAITLTNTEVIKVDNQLFTELMLSNSQLLAPFTNLLLRHFNRRLQHSISTELALQESLQSLDAAYQQLLESEKMAVLGQLIAGVAHELNNPVAAILRGSETLTAMLPRLLENSGFDKITQQTLTNALSISALSTSEVRQRTRQIQHQVADKNIAKKIVNMQLDEHEIIKQQPDSFNEEINKLYQFHQVGTIIRNSQSCANRISSLVQSLKHYAGQDHKEVVCVDIHEGIEETLVIFENRLKHFSMVKEYRDLPLIECHPIELEQVWTNLIANALDVMGNNGTLLITTSHNRGRSPESIEVAIEDTGPGIPDELKNRVFELNYTTKRKGNFGLGIGLTISSQIIKRHHGHIRIEQGEMGGAKFIVQLPVVQRHKTLTDEND